MPPTRPDNWKTIAPPPLPGTTFDGQQALLRLPVADLDIALARLKDTLKPLAVSPEEYDATVRKIEEFAGKGGVGRELHARLVKRAEETPHWLEQWWDDAGYLGYRESVVVNVSYYYGFTPQPAHLPQNAVSRAAALTRGALLFRQKYKQGVLEPERMKGTAICMDTYRWMFDCARVPHEALDWSVTAAKEGDDGSAPHHVTVLRRGRVWKMDAMTGGRLLSTSEFERQIEYIIDHTDKEYPAVGALAATHRDTWYKNYLELHSDPHNASVLTSIHSSAFVLCLDTLPGTDPHSPNQPPLDQAAFSRQLWHAGAHGAAMHNRWVDKPVQLVVFDNAQAGIMGEHSVMDGTPTARMCDDVLGWLADPTFDHGPSSSASTELSNPTPLDFKISPKTAGAIKAAKTEVADLTDSQDLTWFVTAYGKGLIKQLGFSPDSWAQLMVQLAYRRLAGPDALPAATYEAASTRKFYKGRTETIRVLSSESDAWTRAMDDPSQTIEQRQALFKAAVKVHGTRAREAGNADGVDRLMFGMRKSLWEGEKAPALFGDELLGRSTYWKLSTSMIHSNYFAVYGWGEVVPDGYGVAYVTGFEDRLQYTITSRIPNVPFCEQIKKASEDMRELFTSGEDKAKL